MSSRKKNKSHEGRKLFQMFLLPELHSQLKARCEEESLPMCAWVRQQIIYALDKPSQRAMARQEAPTNRA